MTTQATLYIPPSRVLPGDLLVTDLADATVIGWRANADATFTATITGELDGTGLRLSPGRPRLPCCHIRVPFGTVTHRDASCGGRAVAQTQAPGHHPLTDATGPPLYVRAQPLRLPTLTWLGEHPAAYEPEKTSGRLYRCIRCNARDGWSLRCELGLTVHLPVAAAEPYTVDDLAAAAEWWLGKGYQVKPLPSDAHPTYRVCAVCSRRDLEDRQIGLPRGVPLSLNGQ